MKAIVCVCLFVVVGIAFARPNEDKYNNKYDQVNVEEILENDRLRAPYLKCLVDEGPVKCPPDAKELKLHLKDALETHCEKCTDIQKEKTKIVIKYLIEKHPEEWSKLKQKYDPDNKYSKKYEDDLKAIQAAA